MLELAVGIGLCVIMFRIAAASNRSGVTWFGITFVGCALSLFIPLPYLRFLIVGVVVLLCLTLTNKT